MVGGKIRRRRQRRVRRIAIDYRPAIGALHTLFIRFAVKLGVLRLGGEVIELSLGEIGLFVAAKRHVELAAQVVAAQAVVAMTIQIQEQHRATQGILTLVEFITVLVVALCGVIFRRKHLTCRADVFVGAQFDDVIQTDQVAIDIRENITRKVGIQEYRPGAHEGLNQAFTFRQMLFNIVKQGVFPPCPLQKSAILFHAA